MAVLKGHSADIQWDSSDVEQCQNWTLNIDGGLLEDTEFGDSWKSFVSGIKSWSGTAKGNFDSSDTNGHVALKTAALDGTSATVKLELSGSNYLSGTAFVTANWSVDVNGLVEVTYNFQGTGALSYT